MITPAFSPTATERVLPRLTLDFTTGVLDSRVTITRALNTATRTNSSGNIELVNANLPRFDYSPTTFAPLGLLIEETKTNLLLNSLINGTNLSTQSVTLSAVAYTLSFYGSGSITITGGASATVTGAGAYPSRKTYTFTPTAGATTFTVSGTVQYAQLETGLFATSFIPTAGTSAIRNADVVQMTGTNFSSWFSSAAAGAFVVQGDSFRATSQAAHFYSIDDGTANNRFWCYATIGSGITSRITTSGSLVYDQVLGSAPANTVVKTTTGFALNNTNSGVEGAVGTTDTSVSIPTVTVANIGANVGQVYLNGHIQLFQFFPQRLTNAELQAFSKRG